MEQLVSDMSATAIGEVVTSGSPGVGEGCGEVGLGRKLGPMNDHGPSSGDGADGGGDTRQAEVTSRYDRLARVYDLFERPMEMMVGGRKRRLLDRARGRTLELGVGTGRNLTLYRPSVQLQAIDISEKMLERAGRRARRHDLDLELDVADIQHLPYPDDSFDTVTATCVFCSVADPVAGLREAARVVKGDGQVLLLEHVRPRNPMLGWLADRVNPVVRRLVGPEINRRTEDNVVRAGLDIVEVTSHGVWREIVATPR
jgi:ubiquinone/menaquinone biosynthesis C-methylase UbiE